MDHRFSFCTRVLKGILATLFFILTLTVASKCSSSTRSTGASETVPANVVLITIDTLRPDHLGCYGNRSVRTTALDALSARGTRFAQAVTAVPLTLPSHVSILTGTYPFVHGVRDNLGFVLGDSPPTLATVFRQAGFHTAGFVGAAVLDHRFGLNRGFETYDDRMPPVDLAASVAHEAEVRAEVVVNRVIAWLGGRPPGRFFLWVHVYDPHAPYDPPEPYRSQYAGRLYDGEIAYTDVQLGRLLKAFQLQGLADKTLFVLLGDHGEGLGDHGESAHGIFLYDTTVRIPFILAGPGVPSGQVVQAQVRSIDLMPTILSICHLQVPNQSQGISLKPLMEGTASLPSESRFAYLETIYPRTTMGWSPLRALRTAEWKYIEAPEEELYDFRSDSREALNRLPSNPATAERYKKLIAGMLGDQGSQRIKGNAVSAELRQELASLGYVSAGVSETPEVNSSLPDPKKRIGLLGTFEVADQFMVSGEYNEALPRLEAAVEADPGNPLFNLRLGICSELSGNPRAAMGVYERAIQHHAGTDELYFRYATLLEGEGELLQAVQAFGRSLELNPDHAESLDGLGMCDLKLDRLPEAERAFQHLLEKDPGRASACNGLGLIRVRQGRRSEAAIEFQKALAVDPDYWDAWLNLGLDYREEGQREEARRCLKRFLDGASPKRYGRSIQVARKAMDSLESNMSK
ncbi:MAG: sulfatase-like hydrolase/transferase [Terriglobia bacterium]|jgi:choline-sulfatase